MLTPEQRAKEYKDLYERAMQHIASLEDRLVVEMDINDQYRAWFNNHRFLVSPREEPITSEQTMYHNAELSPVAPKPLEE